MVFQVCYSEAALSEAEERPRSATQSRGNSRRRRKVSGQIMSFCINIEVRPIPPPGFVVQAAFKGSFLNTSLSTLFFVFQKYKKQRNENRRLLGPPNATCEAT